MQPAPDKEIKYKDFTSLDFDSYMNILAPFRDKVYRQEISLNDQELESVNGVLEELLNNYSRESLDGFKMVEEIIGIREREYILKHIKKYGSLCREYDLLWSEYRRKKGEGKLTPKEKKKIFDRLNEIQPLISDHHY